MFLFFCSRLFFFCHRFRLFFLFRLNFLHYYLGLFNWLYRFWLWLFLLLFYRFFYHFFYFTNRFWTRKLYPTFNNFSFCLALFSSNTFFLLLTLHLHTKFFLLLLLLFRNLFRGYFLALIGLEFIQQHLIYFTRDFGGWPSVNIMTFRRQIVYRPIQ